MQSVNEELITVNAELQSKIEQLAGIQNDMKNLLDNINIGTVFLDRNLTIRRFTRDATRVYRLVATDVGRPLADIKSNLNDDILMADAVEVLESLVPREREIRVGGTTSYMVRVQPYRTLDNVIEGVVLTFTDITKRVAAEEAERAARQLAESIVDTVREPLLVLDGEMRVVSASHSFYRRFGATTDGTINRRISDLGNRQFDIPELHELMANILPDKVGFEDFPVGLELPDGGRCKMLLNARRVLSSAEARPLILLAMEEVKY